MIVFPKLTSLKKLNISGNAINLLKYIVAQNKVPPNKNENNIAFLESYHFESFNRNIERNIETIPANKLIR